MGDIPHFTWKVKAGDGEGYSFEIPEELQELTDHASVVAPDAVPHRGVSVALGIDVAEMPEVLRIFFTGDQLTVAMDGWEGDVQGLDAHGQPFTLVEFELRVDPEWTP